MLRKLHLSTKPQGVACVLCVGVWVCVYVCGCVLRAYGVRCMGRLWAEMRREFLSCCVMSIYPCSDGGFPNNGVEAEGQKAMTVNKNKK